MEFLMDFDCLSQNMSISRLHDNISVFYKYYYFSSRKHWPTSGGRSNLKLPHFSLSNPNPSKILFELKVHLKNIHIKIITYM